MEGSDESGEARLYTSLCVAFVNVNMLMLSLCIDDHGKEIISVVIMMFATLNLFV